MVTTVEQLAALVRGRLDGDGSVAITSARPVADAGPGDITFIESERFAKHLRTSPASAAVVGPHFRAKGGATPEAMPVIEVDDPMTAFLAIRTHLVGDRPPRWVGVHPMAAVAATAVIQADVAVHAFVAVGEGAFIGAGTTLHPGAVVGAGCRIGRDCVIHPNAVLYPDVIVGDRVEVHSGTVVGGDGFKYQLVQGRHVKIPHTGRVELGDDVEIGSNCTIDRATFEVTRIGEGTKIDNLVMVGHNNNVGRHNLLCAQVGIAGSCRTGDYVVMAGQAGIKDHTEIGDRSIVGAQAGVHSHVPEGQTVLGSPAVPVREQRRLFAMIARLPEMHKALRDLAAQVARLSGPPSAPPEVGPVLGAGRPGDDPTGF